MQALYPERRILLLDGPGICKAENVWTGFRAATGDVLMILDADLTVMPEELPVFFNALVENRGEFINGNRLVYPIPKAAMKFANRVGNKVFGMVFSFLLDQRIKDTLCGTKVIWRRDWPRIEKNAGKWGIRDLWGDYDLLFGASKLHLEILDVPVHYQERVYGVTKMTKVFWNGVRMARICWGAWRRLAADGAVLAHRLSFGSKIRLEGLREEPGVEAEGSRFRFEANASVATDQIEAVGPAGVLGFHAILNGIEQRGNRDVELSHARGRDTGALFIGSRISKEHVLFDIALHLPDIGRMRLGDIDDVESGAILVLLVELVERGNLPAKWRSGVTAEDEDHWLRSAKGRECRGAGTIEERKREIRRCIADVPFAGTRALPHRFEGEQQEGSGSDVHHQPREGLGRLMHGVIETGQHRGVEREERDGGQKKPALPLARLRVTSAAFFGRAANGRRTHCGSIEDLADDRHRPKV